MTDRDIKRKAKSFVIEYSLQKVNYSSLCDVTERLGYVIVEFDPCIDDSEEYQLAKILKLADKINNTRGMTYAKGEYRLIFVDDRLSESEKSIVLAHELGHIVMGHMDRNYVIGKDVVEEYEANLFASFLLEKKHGGAFLRYIIAAALGMCSLGIIIIIFLLINKNINIGNGSVIVEGEIGTNTSAIQTEKNSEVSSDENPVTTRQSSDSEYSTGSDNETSDFAESSESQTLTEIETEIETEESMSDETEAESEIEPQESTLQTETEREQGIETEATRKPEKTSAITVATTVVNTTIEKTTVPKTSVPKTTEVKSTETNTTEKPVEKTTEIPQTTTVPETTTLHKHVEVTEQFVSEDNKQYITRCYCSQCGAEISRSATNILVNLSDPYTVSKLSGIGLYGTSSDYSMLAAKGMKNSAMSNLTIHQIDEGERMSLEQKVLGALFDYYPNHGILTPEIVIDRQMCNQAQSEVDRIVFLKDYSPGTDIYGEGYGFCNGEEKIESLFYRSFGDKTKWQYNLYHTCFKASKEIVGDEVKIGIGLVVASYIGYDGNVYTTYTGRIIYDKKDYYSIR